MNGLTVVVLAILLISAVTGYRRGLVRKMAGIAALAVSWTLVSLALPYITDFLETQTPVYSFIVSQCESAVNKKITEQFLPTAVTGTNENGIDREQVKELMNQYGMDSSVVDGMSDTELESVISLYFQDYVDQYQNAMQEQSSLENLSLTKIEQTELIKNLPLPDTLKETMLNYNNSEGYSKLQVTDFKGYIVQFFARIILNIAAFVLTLLVVQVVVWTGITALDLFAHLPVLNLLNSAGGLLLGALQGLLVVWVVFLLIAVFAATDGGMALMKMIQESEFLTGLYDSNLFLKIIAQSTANFL